VNVVACLVWKMERAVFGPLLVPNSHLHPPLRTTLPDGPGACWGRAWEGKLGGVGAWRLKQLLYFAASLLCRLHGRVLARSCSSSTVKGVWVPMRHLRWRYLPVSLSLSSSWIQ